MNMRLPSKKFFVGMFSILAAIAILMTIAPAVYAADSGPLSPIPGLGRPSNDVLIRMHKTESGWYSDQDALIKKAVQLEASFQTLIDAESKAGKNVSMLQDALATFDAEITACKNIHGEAANTIFSLAAWNSAGDIVRDRLAAGSSLLDGRAQLQDANFRLTNAMPTLERTFNLWRATRINPDRATKVAPTPGCIASDILPCPVYP